MRKPVLWAVLVLAVSGPPALAQQRTGGSYTVAAPSDELLVRGITVTDLTDLDDLGPGWWPGGFDPATPPLGPSNPLYLAGSPYDGIARLLAFHPDGVSGCTGSLLWTGRDVLTAAHCVYDFNMGTFVPNTSLRVDFYNAADPGVRATHTSSAVIGKAEYDGALVSPHDLAIIRLDEEAAAWVPRYDLFTGNPMHQEVELVGYGLTGNGVTGGVMSSLFTPNPERRVVLNSFEMTRSATSYHLQLDMQPSTPIVVADFDGARPGGTYPVTGGGWPTQTLAQNNTTCNFWEPVPMPDFLRSAICHSGYGIREGMVGPGDSGGPAMIMFEGFLQLAAVASFTTARCVPSQFGQTSALCRDIGLPGFITNAAYFGGLGHHVAVSYGDNHTWIHANVHSSVVPEPGSLVLLATGLASLAGALRRRRRAQDPQV